MKKISLSIGADHAGLEVKNTLIKIKQLNSPSLNDTLIEWKDVGTFSGDRVDYPDFAKRVVGDVAQGKTDFGVLVCGTGIGMSIAANRDRKLRAAMIYSSETAALCRQHNNANVACFGSRTQKPEDIIHWLEIFLSTEYEGGRHEERLKKLS